MSTLATVAETTAQKTLSSLELSEISGRRHDHILRSIERINKDLIQMQRPPAGLVKYKDKKGEERPMYQLTKYQCELLAMALSGEARIRVLDRLHEMETKMIESPTSSIVEMKKLIDSVDLLNEDEVTNVLFGNMRLVLRLQENLQKKDNKVQALESMSPQDHLQSFINAQVEQRVALIAPKTFDDTHRTIKGWASENKLRITNGLAIRLANIAKRLCTDTGEKVEKIGDTRYGKLNVYPIEILEQAYGLVK